jgi:hypothetical protein
MRSGIDIDADTVWERFEAGPGEEDPALLWYVDVRCEGDRLPTGKDEARQWLLHNAPLVKAGLRQLAEKLDAGYDNGFWPLHWPIPGAPEGISVTVICSAVRRWDARRIAGVLTEIAQHWEQILEQLAPAEAV